MAVYTGYVFMPQHIMAILHYFEVVQWRWPLPSTLRSCLSLAYRWSVGRLLGLRQRSFPTLLLQNFSPSFQSKVSIKEQSSELLPDAVLNGVIRPPLLWLWDCEVCLTWPWMKVRLVSFYMYLQSSALFSSCWATGLLSFKIRQLMDSKTLFEPNLSFEPGSEAWAGVAAFKVPSLNFSHLHPWRCFPSF